MVVRAATNFAECPRDQTGWGRGRSWGLAWRGTLRQTVVPPKSLQVGFYEPVQMEPQGISGEFQGSHSEGKDRNRKALLLVYKQQ